MTSHPIINGHNQRGFLLLNKVLINAEIGPITIGKPIGQINLILSPQHLQGLLHNRAGGHAIGIVVPVDQDLLASFNGRTNPLDSLIHIMK